MRIADICNRDVVSTDRQTTLREAACLMRERHIGSLLVTTDTAKGQRALGIVSDRDLAIEALSRGLDTDAVTIERLAELRLVTIASDAGLGEAIDAMKQSGVRRLLVADADGRLAGIVALEDLLEALAAEMNGLAQALRSGMQREATEREPLPVQAQQPAAPPLFIH